LRLSWATREERSSLEQAILDLFWGQETTPGTLVLPVHVEPHGDFFACFRVEETLWENDSATIPAEHRHQSTLTLSADVPAVGLRTGVHPITTLELGIGDELDDTWEETEVFRVSADGELTPQGVADGE